MSCRTFNAHTSCSTVAQAKMTIRPLLLTCFLFISMTNGSFVHDIKDLKGKLQVIITVD